MQAIAKGYKGLSLLLDLNWDLVVILLALALSLFFGAWLASQAEFVPMVGRV